MAEHTSSSITIEAAPAEVMKVISDFERYPQWTGEVKQAEIRRIAGCGMNDVARIAKHIERGK